MSKLLAIDPGPETSGMVLLYVSEWPPRVIRAERAATLLDVRIAITDDLEEGDQIVCEWLTSYGHAVGKTTLDTARVVGRVEEIAWFDDHDFGLMTRPDVALELCQRRNAKDAQMSEAIREIYREAGLAIGGGKEPVRGTKEAPGPLYGVALGDHEGSALAVGVAWARQQREAK